MYHTRENIGINARESTGVKTIKQQTRLRMAGWSWVSLWAQP